MLIGAASGLMPMPMLRQRVMLPPLPVASCAGARIGKDGCGLLERQQAPRRLGRPTMQFHHGHDDGFSFWGAAKVGKPQQVMQGQREAYVLIFRPGAQDEGVYTLQGTPREPASATSFVLAFERTDDATHFAQLLHAQGFDVATPLSWSSYDLVSFCDGAGYEVSLVPGGAQIEPPPKHAPPSNFENSWPPERFDRRFGGPRFEDPHLGGPRMGDPRFGDLNIDGPRFGDNRFGDPRIGDPRFGDPRIGDSRFGDPRMGGPRFDPSPFGGMMGNPGDPGRNYPGLDPTRPDAFAMERSRLEALLPVEPEECLLDGADDDCLHDDENSN